jgi:hypothetical protein
MLSKPLQSRQTAMQVTKSTKGVSSFVLSLPLNHCTKCWQVSVVTLVHCKKQINVSAKVDFHNFFAIGKFCGVLVKRAITVDGDHHERAPTIVLALILDAFQKRHGGSPQDIEANMVA